MDFQQKIQWSRLNNIFNIIIGKNYSNKEILRITCGIFKQYPYYFIYDKFALAYLFEEASTSIYNSYLDEIEKVWDLRKNVCNHFLLNTGIETYDLNIYFK